MQYMKGVGPQKVLLLARLGIATVDDMLTFFPRDYDDRSCVTQISAIREGQECTVNAKVVSVASRKIRRGLSLLTVIVADGSGTLSIVFFNQPYLKKYFVPGKVCLFSGKIARKYGFSMASPTYEFLSGDAEDTLHTGRIVPVYSLTEGLSQRGMRRLIRQTLDMALPWAQETLPVFLREKYKLLARKEALLAIHFPDNEDGLQAARRRLIFEEFFVLQMGLAMRRRELDDVRQTTGIVFSKNHRLMDDFLQALPFRLTGAQKRVVDEIMADMTAPRMMHRLVHGDVGSGKTIVALCALLLAVGSGYQAALMAPTEILAEQHFLHIKRLLAPRGICIACLSGGQSKKEKEALAVAIANGSIQVIVGTHALLQDTVTFHRLGLVIVDEQHKFGVLERATLKRKGHSPDMLIMTATPIPRTLTMTVYGDLDVSMIDEMPGGRKPVRTFLMSDAKKERLYRFVREQIAAGKQAYFVYPLVEESEKMDMKAATVWHAHLSQDIFPDISVSLLHGKMRPKEKEAVMLAFKQKQSHILVATTVIEVGIDIPDATVMVVENAERFGLAQLHQLRGRVGRDIHQSYCILVSSPKTEEAHRRMQVMCNTCDGFKVAEEDLAIRGPGEFFGVKQHGLPELRIGSILSDVRVMECARQDASQIVNTWSLYKQDPEIPHLLKALHRRYQDKLDCSAIG